MNKPQIIAFPISFIQNYSFLGLTDREFIILITYIGTDGDKTLTAHLLGYKTTTSVTQLLNKLANNNLIDGDDFTKLYTALKSDVPVIRPPEPKKKDNTHYKLVGKIGIEKFYNNNKHGAAEALKRLLKEYDEKDIIVFVSYLYSFHNHDKTISTGVPLGWITSNNMSEWIAGGCKSAYTPPGKVADLV